MPEAPPKPFRLYSFIWNIHGSVFRSADTFEEALDILVGELGLEGPNQKIPEADSVTVVYKDRKLGKIDAYDRDEGFFGGKGRLRDVSRAGLERQLRELMAGYEDAPVSRRPGRPAKPSTFTRIQRVLDRHTVEGRVVADRPMFERDVREALAS